MSTFASSSVERLTREQDRERLEGIAAEKGLVALFPDYNQMQIDIDNEESLKVFQARLKWYETLPELFYKVLSIQYSTSKSGNLHVHITSVDKHDSEEGLKILNEAMNKENHLERIACQMFLGSDPKRELLSMIAANADKFYPTVFFETPGYTLREEVGDMLFSGMKEKNPKVDPAVASNLVFQNLMKTMHQLSQK